MLAEDSLANVLYIDLSQKRFWVERRSDLFDKYLGGAGVAIQLLLETCPEGCDPYHDGNPIVLAVGPLTGLFPLASKTVAMFKSPLTGNLGESHCGGRSAVAIRLAGYGAIVIKGKSNIPIWLSVHGNNVQFRDAATLWGMSHTSTVGRIIRENEPGAGLRSIMRIGRAGEKLIPYAAVMTETYRHFGRLGLGAVFGSKNLKALVVAGNSSLPVANRKQYRSLYDTAYEAAVQSPVMQKYHDLGTAENILPLNEIGGLPTHNVQSGYFEGAREISGEALADGFLGRRLACAHCPVGCIHIAALREPYEDESYFYKTSMISYDYELLYALGTMLGISDPKGVLKLIDRVEAVGLDAMSTGVVLAWATETLERGLISARETGGLKLSWGDAATYMQAVKRIVDQPNDFYKALGQGVESASAIYGGAEFAMALGRNEMPGYHTGPAAYLGFSMGARHSHLDNAGYSADQKTLIKQPLAAEKLADSLLEEERWRQILSSLVVCFFARGIYKPELVCQALQMSGFDLSPDDLNRLGREIHNEKFCFKLREGFSFEGLRLPARIFETEAPVKGFDETYIRRALAHVKEAVVA